MTFKDYLISRRIDPSAFARNEPRRYREFGKLYDQVHIKSFIMQKLFVLNLLRKNYPYIPSETEVNIKPVGASSKKPAMRPKPAKTVADSAGKKPAVKPAKPRMKPKTGTKSSSGISKKPTPVIKPKQSSTKEVKVKSSVKPKVKPVIKPASKATESDQSKKPARPVIKPRPKSD